MPRCISFLIALLFSASIFAQTAVEGYVFDSDSVEIAGATVYNTTQNIGTITNIDGYFSIKAALNDTISISFLGNETVQIPVKSFKQQHFYLNPDVYSVNEVVVTALGIKKDSKALGYSATSLSGDDISQSGESGALNALQGKVAGVNVSSASSSPGASTRIIVRGVTSLSGSNQPLIVVDGVPINNSQTGSSSIGGGVDFGNKANDLNPEDYESWTILKGAAATVKYGSRAANGVIEIVTKKGSTKSSAPFFTYSGSVTYDQPSRLVDYQNSFGQGLYGNAVSAENTSWGPAFDDQIHPWGNAVDNQIKVKSYSGLQNNVRDFFDTGIRIKNALSLNKADENMTYYLSYSNVKADGIFPTDVDAFSRNTVSLRSTTKFGERFTTNTSLNFVLKNSGFVPTGQGAQSVYNQVMQTPRDISLLEIADINSEWNNLDNYYSLYTVNPYFILKNNYNNHTEQRGYGSTEFSFQFNEFLKFMWRGGADYSAEVISTFTEKIEPEGNNELASVFEPGSKTVSNITRQQLTSDFFLFFDKSFEVIELNVMLGQNINTSEVSYNSSGVSNLILSGFDNFSNGADNPYNSESFSMKRMTGVFGSIDLNFVNTLFLSLSARNDWSSTLPEQNNSFFYPGANLSFVFTELLNKKSPVFPFGKLRIGWAHIGKDAPVYVTGNYFSQSAHADGYAYFSYPLSNGNVSLNAFSVGNVLGNPDLQPEFTNEIEIGTDLRFFQNRIRIDAAYYQHIVSNQIWAVPIPSSQGYTSQIKNLGKIENKGVEVLLELKPIKKENFNYTIGISYAHNRNKLLELSEGLEKVVLNQLTVEGGQQIFYVAKPGKPVGVFEARTVLRNDEGQVVVDNNGLPRASEELIEYGTSEYDFTAGINQQFTWKKVSLNINFDIRQGGLMYSRTKDISGWAGTAIETTYNNRQPFIVPNSVIEVGTHADDTKHYVENTIPIGDEQMTNYWGNGGMEIDGFALVDKSFIKLREMSLYVNLLDNQLKIKSLDVGIVGRNLLLITPASQQHIDPEVTTFGNDLGADFGEYGAQPATRSVSVSLKMTI